MNIKDILSKVDHTLLATDATWDRIKIICDDGIKYGCASVCIPPSFVREAKAYVGDKIKICTVIGFPNGYNTTAVKCFEAADAVAGGADEVDLVINVTHVKDGKFDLVLDEICSVKKASGDAVLKVIIETCLLTEEEKTCLCQIVSKSGADFIKTSTGFSTGGATREDVSLMAKHSQPHLKIKAAGGIKTLKDAEDFIALGASRLGTSRIVSLLKNEEAKSSY